MACSKYAELWRNRKSDGRAWHHRHHPQQGIGNRAIDPGPEIGATVGTVKMRSGMAGTRVHWERIAAKNAVNSTMR